MANNLNRCLRVKSRGGDLRSEIRKEVAKVCLGVVLENMIWEVDTLLEVVFEPLGSIKDIALMNVMLVGMGQGAKSIVRTGQLEV